MSDPTDSSPDSSPDSSYDLAPVAPPPARESAPEEPAARLPVPAQPAIPGGPAVPTLSEKACPHCGFRVVGRPRNNRCPECGAQLNEAAADLLQFAPVGWTRTVAVGPLVLIAAVLGHVAAILRTYDLLHLGQPIPLHAAAAAFTVLGVWLLTLKDPHPQSRRPDKVWTARSLSLALLLFWILLAMYPPQDPDLRETRVDVLFLLAQVTLAALAFIVCGYARELALRIPNDSVAHHFYLLSYAMIPFLVVAMVGHFVVLERFMIAFFCSFPAIAVLGIIALWLMVSFLRLSLDMYVSAATGESIKERRERVIAAQKKPPR